MSTSKAARARGSHRSRPEYGQEGGASKLGACGRDLLRVELYVVPICGQFASRRKRAHAFGDVVQCDVGGQ
jgi:hypothetical protein